MDATALLKRQLCQPSFATGKKSLIKISWNTNTNWDTEGTSIKQFSTFDVVNLKIYSLGIYNSLQF